MRTTTGLERLNKELKRRTRVARQVVSQLGQLPALDQRLAGRTRRGVDERKNLPLHEALSMTNHQYPRPNLGNLQKRRCFIISDPLGVGAGVHSFNHVHGVLGA